MSVSTLLYVCLPVCLTAVMSQKLHVQTSRNFLYVLTVVTARSFSGDNTIRYVGLLPVSVRFCRRRHFGHIRPVERDANRAHKATQQGAV